MKLLCLNILGGYYKKDLLDFLAEQKTSYDIFCLQEVFHQGQSTRPRMNGSDMNIFSEMDKILNDFTGEFSPHQDNEEGLAIFYRKNLDIQETGDYFVHKFKNAMTNNHGGTLGRQLQFIKYIYENKIYNILNFHGLWDERGKVDTEERIEQSRKIVEFIKKLSGNVILAGDFNYMHDIESIKLIESEGLINLITKFEVTSTRSEVHTDPVKFADYIFVSKGIKVKNFEVLDIFVSDHLPMLLEYS